MDSSRVDTVKRNYAIGTKTQKQIEERAIEIAEYIIECRATVRQAAKQFGVSKSTVHKDTQRMQYIDKALADQVRQVLEMNKSERHIRGGMATKEKYLHRADLCGERNREFDTAYHSHTGESDSF